MVLFLFPYDLMIVVECVIEAVYGFLSSIYDNASFH
jgi:hypothetical protein